MGIIIIVIKATGRGAKEEGLGYECSPGCILGFIYLLV